jgi:hypothetical protein
MAFIRTNLTGNVGAGSSAPTLYTYLGTAADLNNDAVLKSFNAKGGDILIVVAATDTGVITIFGVQDDAGTLSTQAMA